MQESHAEHVAQQASHKLLAPFVAGLRSRKPVGSAATVFYDSDADVAPEAARSHGAALGASAAGSAADLRCGGCDATVKRAAGAGSDGDWYMRCSQCEVTPYCDERCQVKYTRNACVASDV